MEHHRLPAQDIPILAEVDFAIIGGTFAGLASALQFAYQGKRVIVVESRTYLGSELTAKLSPWITSSQATMPRLIEACVKASGKTISHGNSLSTVFHIDRLKIQLEEELISAGVQVLYASLPIGI
ncbi:MAG: FAD-dependent oxidoreductase, partial [Bacillus sp. (in: firmicutes)]